jgi:hypothetical protein
LGCDDRRADRNDIGCTYGSHTIETWRITGARSITPQGGPPKRSNAPRSGLSEPSYFAFMGYAISLFWSAD